MMHQICCVKWRISPGSVIVDIRSLQVAREETPKKGSNTAMPITVLLCKR
jgi:hypothetical protein